MSGLVFVLGRLSGENGTKKCYDPDLIPENVVAPLAGARFVYSSQLPGRFIVFYPIADVVLRCVE